MSPISWTPSTPHEKQDAPPPSRSAWSTGDPWFGVSMGLLGTIAGYAANVYIF